MTHRPCFGHLPHVLYVPCDYTNETPVQITAWHNSAGNNISFPATCLKMVSRPSWPRFTSRWQEGKIYVTHEGGMRTWEFNSAKTISSAHHRNAGKKKNIVRWVISHHILKWVSACVMYCNSAGLNVWPLQLSPLVALWHCGGAVPFLMGVLFIPPHTLLIYDCSEGLRWNSTSLTHGWLGFSFICHPFVSTLPGVATHSVLSCVLIRKREFFF